MAVGQYLSVAGRHERVEFVRFRDVGYEVHLQKRAPKGDCD